MYIVAEDNFYYELFRQYVSVLYEHIEVVSEPDGCYEVVKFLAHLFRDEIRCFVENVEKEGITDSGIIEYIQLDNFWDE